MDRINRKTAAAECPQGYKSPRAVRTLLSDAFDFELRFYNVRPVITTGETHK